MFFVIFFHISNLFIILLYSSILTPFYLVTIALVLLIIIIYLFILGTSRKFRLLDEGTLWTNQASANGRATKRVCARPML